MAFDIANLVPGEPIQVNGETYALYGTLGSYVPSVSSVPWDIFIDGVSIKNRLLSGKVDYSEGQVHNSITLSFAGELGIFDQCNTTINYGFSRIELQLETRALYFLLEERTGTEKDFSVWGRSLTALEDAPYKIETAYELDERRLASDVAQELAGSRVLDWECVDWVLPKDFQFIGTPVQGLQILVDQIGGVLRSTDDGSFLVRDKYPIRPVDIASEPAILQYDRVNNIIELSFSESNGLLYNSVPVNGKTYSYNSPILETRSEENTFIIGQEAIIRCYYGQNDVAVSDVFTTHGSIILQGTFYEEEEETIVISEGTGNVKYYIDSLVSHSWEGFPGGVPLWEQDSQTITLEDPVSRVLKIKYMTRYQRFVAIGHNVEMLYLIFTYGSNLDISVDVSFFAGGRIAPLLTRELLTSEESAIAAGTAWLDDNVYSKTTLRVKAPYKSLAIDGTTILVENERIRINGNGKIVSANILFTGIRIHNELEVDLWPIF